MIKTMEMFSVECDNCKDIYTDENDTGFCAWMDFGQAIEAAESDGWHTTDKGDMHYCPKCYKMDDDDNLIINPIPIKSPKNDN